MRSFKVRLLSILALLLVLTTACSSNTQYAVPVTVMGAASYNIPSTLRFSALLRGEMEAELSFENQGEIKNLYVNVGDEVKAGQILGSLDGAFEFQNVQSAELAYQNAHALYVNTVDKMRAYVLQAEEGLNTAQVSFQSASTNLDNETQLSGSKWEEAALSLESLNVQKQNLTVLYNQNRAATLLSLETALNQMLITVHNALDYLYSVNDLNLNHKDVNFAFHHYFVTPHSTNLLEMDIENAVRAYKKFESNHTTFFDEEVHDEEVLLELILEGETLAENVVAALHDVSTIVGSFIPTNHVSQEEIDAMSAQFYSYTSNVESALMSQSGGGLSGLRGMRQNLEALDLQYAASLDSLDQQILIAEQQLVLLEDGNQSSVDFYENNLNLAEAQYQQASIALEVAKKEEVLQVQVAKSAMDAAYGQKLMNLALYENTQIIAPFDGVITRKYHDLGNHVASGEVVYSLVNMESLKFFITVPASFLRYLSLGDLAKIVPEGSTDEETLIIAEVSHLPPALDISTGSALVEMKVLDDVNLAPGTYVDVFFDNSLDQFVSAVPEEALTSSGDQSFLFLAVDGKAELREVKRGMEFEGKVEILEGLSAEDWIVVQGNDSLYEGATLEIVNSKTTQLHNEK